MMVNGETTKYHEAARGIEGQRIAAGSFNGVNEGADEKLRAAAPPPNAFGNVNDPRNQREVLLGLGGNIDGVQDRGKALAQHNEAVKKRADQSRKSTNDAAFLDMLDKQIRNFEAATAAQYGEDFAENLLADLHQKGVVEQSDMDRINKIQDPEERRREIAKLIKQGLNDGSIKPEDIEGHPWAKKWIDLHARRQAEASREANAVASGKQTVDQTNDKGLTLAAQAETSRKPGEVGALEAEAEKRADQNVADAGATADAFASFDLGGLS